MCGYGSILVLGIRIWIHKSPEYGSNTDLDPQNSFKVKITCFQVGVGARAGIYRSVAGICPEPEM